MKLLVKLLLTAILFQGCSKDQPKSQSMKTSSQSIKPNVPSFDGKIAFVYLQKQTDFGPRSPGSASHEKCLEFLQSELSKYAEAVDLQPFNHQGYDNKILNLTNVIASFNLNAPTRILLLAHWDSRPRADQDSVISKRDRPILGANDGASGVAVLLEIARHLKEHAPAVGIDILLTDGEDYGKESDLANYFLGARYFAKNLPQNFAPVFGILLDMVGDRQLEILKESYSIKYAPDVVDLVWTTAKELNVDQFVNQTRLYSVQDDHLPLNEVGIKTIDLIDFSYPDESNRYWHTTQDTPDKCSPESLEAVGKVLMHVIYQYPV